MIDSVSKFARRFTRSSGTKQLMEDLGDVANLPGKLINLGGGNPGHIEEVQEVFLRQLKQCVHDRSIDDVIRRYDGPQGYLPFRRELAALLHKRYGWPLGPEHVAITAGSQASFFMLFNAFAGEFDDGSFKRVMLPLAPEYIGYADVGISADMIRATPARIEKLSSNSFKYRLNFGPSDLTEDIGLVCVSRPTNPTGNVLTNDELSSLITITKNANVPFVIDGAYGLPFPNIIFNDAAPMWDEHVVLCLSLSKIGLPGLRTGIVIAQPEVIDLVTSMNAIITLANSALGAYLVEPLFRSGELIALCNEKIHQFYQQKAQQALKWCDKYFQGFDYYCHRSEGAIFLWLWFPGLPISDQELYQRLKARGVLVLPGNYFFLEGDDNDRHSHECLRISYAQEPSDVEEGIRCIGEEVRKAYGSG